MLPFFFIILLEQGGREKQETRLSNRAGWRRLRVGYVWVAVAAAGDSAWEYWVPRCPLPHHKTVAELPKASIAQHKVFSI